MATALNPSAIKQALSTVVGLFVGSVLLTAPIPNQFIVSLATWTGLSSASVWDLAFIANELVAFALICAIVVVWEHRPLRSVGFRSPSITDVLCGIAVSGLSVWLLALVEGTHSGAPVSEASGAPSALAVLLSLPLWFRISGTIVNAISEETIFRGFAIERLETITRSTWLGTGTAYAANILIHFPAWGVVGALSRAPALFLFVCLYLWRRSLPACILAHLLVDGFSLVLWPIFPRIFQLHFWRLA
jgi:membrane protease YdiL (CAAX protease family)